MAVESTPSDQWRSVRTAELLTGVSLPAADHMLVARPDAWLVDATAAFENERDSALASVGLSGPLSSVRRQVKIVLGPVTRGDHSIRRHIAWNSVHQERLFPSLVGTIAVTRVPGNDLYLEVDARYRPPLGRVGQLADRALMHLVASASIKQFAREVAERMISAADGIDVPPSGRAGFQV